MQHVHPVNYSRQYTFRCSLNDRKVYICSLHFRVQHVLKKEGPFRVQHSSQKECRSRFPIQLYLPPLSLLVSCVLFTFLHLLNSYAQLLKRPSFWTEGVSGNTPLYDRVLHWRDARWRRHHFFDQTHTRDCAYFTDKEERYTWLAG